MKERKRGKTRERERDESVKYNEANKPARKHTQKQNYFKKNKIQNIKNIEQYANLSLDG